MPYQPLNAEYIQQIPKWSYLPNSIKAHNNQSFRFWERSLFLRASSVIELDGLPEEWSGKVKDFLYYCLLRFGFVAVGESDEFGIYFQPATLSGVSFYFQPTKAVWSNPASKKSITLELGKTGELLKLTPDYYGIYDKIVYYAEKLALADSALNTSLVNSKLPYILGGKNRAAAETLKKICDRIGRGEPAIVYDQRIQDDSVTKDSPFQQVSLFSAKDYITDKVMMSFNDILNAFDTEIGIPVIPNEKKERMVTDEANSRKIDSSAQCTVWLRTLNESAAKVNDMFGTAIKATYTYEDKVNGGASDERKDYSMGNE